MKKLLFLMLSLAFATACSDDAAKQIGTLRQKTLSEVHNDISVDCGTLDRDYADYHKEQAIFTNLCMISDGQGNILVEDRIDPSWPGICFPGGHVHANEAFTDSVVREVFEETGLTIHDPRLCGVKQFPTKSGARYVVFFYRATEYSGEVRSSAEGEVFWISKSELQNKRCVPDLLEMIKVMESGDLNEFIYDVDGDDWTLRLLGQFDRLTNMV